MNKPLPDSLMRFSSLPDLQYRGGEEWSSACPKCGGANGSRPDKSDRFRIFAGGGSVGGNPRAWCRNCGHFEWADAPERLTEERSAEIDKLRAEYAEKERARIRKKVEKLREQSYWQGYHEAMSDYHRELWAQQGIDSSLQDYYRLGYAKDCTFWFREESFVSDAMTIPIFDIGWKLVNLQYRLMTPGAAGGKYRFTGGLPAPLFYADPTEKPRGATMLVEGAKKAIVTYSRLGHLANVVAVPSKAPSLRLLDGLDDCDPLYIALDPDAYPDGSASRLGEAAKSPVRYVRLPDKPDDLIVNYGWTSKMFEPYINQATVRI